MAQQKLELTWVGKDKAPKLEPRLLLEIPEKSYHASEKHGEDDQFENMLIHGDNLLALKALEDKYTGQVKCVYIDPPFNTGAAFEHYDDNMEHSIWLDLMAQRFRIIHKLLKKSGCIFVNLDDSEAAYAKILLDEIFERKNYLNDIIVSTNASFGFKSTSDGIFKQANHLLFYAKDKKELKLNADKIFVEKEYDSQYKFVFENTDKPESEWTWRSIRDVVAEQMGFESAAKAKKSNPQELEKQISFYAVENCDRVFRTASVTGGALKKRKDTIEYSKKNRNVIVRHPSDDMDYMFIGGERVIFYSDRIKEIDGVRVPAELLTDVWNDISIEGLAKEGGVDFPKGKKPEKLIKRCIELTTEKGDLVMDSFLGSGTTAAVAHKMGRCWIGIELGDHCFSHCVPRLKNVVDGLDQSGISKSVNWQGGGGFRFYELAPSLIKKDEYGVSVIDSEKFDEARLAEAVCKIMGFTYKPSAEEYFIHGQSTENAYIYVTTNYMTAEHMRSISQALGSKRYLSICCKAFEDVPADCENLNVQKIPKAILDKCEWGKDDYSLNVKNLPMADSVKAKSNVNSQQELDL